MGPQDAVTREELYRGKQVVREEWFVNDLDLVSWARPRVYSDGTADVWDTASSGGSLASPPHALTSGKGTMSIFPGWPLRAKRRFASHRGSRPTRRINPFITVAIGARGWPDQPLRQTGHAIDGPAALAHPPA
jgi:hypothetical protein